MDDKERGIGLVGCSCFTQFDVATNESRLCNVAVEANVAEFGDWVGAEDARTIDVHKGDIESGINPGSVIAGMDGNTLVTFGVGFSERLSSFWYDE